jgi:hypothetical protein
MNVAELRKYRVQFESPIFNSDNQGVALFDLGSSFLVAYLFEGFIRNRINIPREAYYLAIVPLSVLIHFMAKQPTFLTEKLKQPGFNLYKLLIAAMLVGIVYFYRKAGSF